MKARALAGIGLIVAAAILYAATLDNGLQSHELVGGDLITHQYAQVQARPSNAPGYPLYTMGGWLWFHSGRAVIRALGTDQPNPIPILSSYSTLWALVALWLLYEVICRCTESARHPRGNWPIALLIGLFYAVTYFFWYYATTTEQYSSAIAQTLGIVLALIVWLRRPESRWLLFLLAFLCGLSLAHMLTVAFIVPPVVIAVLWTRPAILRNPKSVLGSVIAALLPLASYVFVYVRGARHPEWWGSQEYATAAAWFWHFVSTAQGREELMWAFEPGRPFLGNGFPALIEQELTWIVVLLGLVGIALLSRPLPFVLYATLAIYVVFAWAYRFGNWFQVILPAYALVLVGLGASADRWQSLAVAASERSDLSRAARVVSRAVTVLPILLLSIAIVWRFAASLPSADSRHRAGDDALDRAAILLGGPLRQGSALFAAVEDALALQYLTEIWAVRPDAHVVSSNEAADIIKHQPVYATWDAASTLKQEVASSGSITVTVVSPDWVALHSAPLPADTPDELVADSYAVEFGTNATSGVWLEGYEVRPAPDGTPVARRAGPTYDVYLKWTIPHQGWPEGLSVSVRPTLDGEFVPDPENPGQVIVYDHSMPAELLFDSNPAGGRENAIDPYRIRFPEQLKGAAPGFAVILYRQVDSGFEDVARLDFPLAATENTE